MDADAPPDRPPRAPCGGCGYALDGLPEAGRCPECGRGYARGEAVELAGWGYGRTAAADGVRALWRAPLYLMLLGSLVINGCVVTFLTRSPWLTGFFLVTSGLSFAAVSLARRRNTSGGTVPPLRVYLGPDGLGQAIGRSAAPTRRWAENEAIDLGPAVVGADRDARRDRLADSAGRVRFRLRVGPRSGEWGWWGTETVAVEFHATPAEADALARRLERWRGEAGGRAGVDGAMPQVDPSRGEARRAVHSPP